MNEPSILKKIMPSYWQCQVVNVKRTEAICYWTEEPDIEIPTGVRYVTWRNRFVKVLPLLIQSYWNLRRLDKKIKRRQRLGIPITSSIKHDLYHAERVCFRALVMFGAGRDPYEDEHKTNTKEK